MNRRVVSGTIAALAAIVLAAGSRTLGAFDDNTDVPANTIGAGVLQLDLDNGAGRTALTFADLEPSDVVTQRLWLVSNASTSSTPGGVTIAIGSPVDTPGACGTSRGKALGDLASGIPGCTVTATGALGTPAVGVASRLLVFAMSATTATDPGACAGAAPGPSILPQSGQGNLADLGLAKTTLTLRDTRGRPIVLTPGTGACVIVRASWPPSGTDAAHATPTHPVDDAAQGDSTSFELRFTLTQVPS